MPARRCLSPLALYALFLRQHLLQQHFLRVKVLQALALRYVLAVLVVVFCQEYQELPPRFAVLVVHVVLEEKRHLLQLLRHLLQQLRQPWVQQLRQQQPRLRLERTRG